MAKYIHCTCGQPMVFKINEPIPNDKQVHAIKFVKEIRIGGGAYVITRDNRIPRVVITEVSDEELELLEKLEPFQNMKRRGFITIHTVDHIEADSSGNPMDQEKRDSTSQISDEDHAKGTDSRCDHGGTRATAGENNQDPGKQPFTAEDSDYGPIRL